MNHIGICGDNCEFCPRYVATLKGDSEALAEVRELWVRLGLREPTCTDEEMACRGCRTENNCAYPEVRACVWGKGIESCGFCEAYPCRLIEAVFRKTEKLRDEVARLCTNEEMQALGKAFLMKRKNLDRVRGGKKEGA